MPRGACRGRATAGNKTRAAGILLAAVVWAGSACAEVGAAVSGYSDYRFRGYSLSDGRPVAILDVSYDLPTGVYASASGSVVASRGHGIRPLRLALNGGYATTAWRGVTADVGVIHARYSRYSGLTADRAYTEIYAGLAAKMAGARLSLSPDYLGSARWTLRGELSGHVDLSRTVGVTGVAGALVPLDERYARASRATWDARLGIAKRVGRVSLQAAATARGKGGDLYGSSSRRRAAFIVGISSAL
ncbi:MAG TPA: TorF family putative porin [Sphingomicrobium sp.]|nr:TorF family putative porin [Sphingomicrobium sp.]